MSMTPDQFVESVQPYFPVGNWLEIISRGEAFVSPIRDDGKDMWLRPEEAESMIIGAVVGAWPRVETEQLDCAWRFTIYDEDGCTIASEAAPTACLAALAANAEARSK